MGPSSTKKVKVQWGTTKKTYLNDPANVSAPEDFQKNSKLVESFTDEMNGDLVKNKKKKKKKPFDMMSIVQGTELKAASKPVRQKETGKSAKVEKNAAGLRVKKIMWRPSEDKDPDAVVQKLKTEIREAVQNKPSGDIGKNIFVPILLAAFRAAVENLQMNQLRRYHLQWSKQKKLMF